MHITCPTCGKTIPGADIDLAGGRAVCRPCAELIPLPAVLAGTAAPLPAVEGREGGADYRPEALRWQEHRDGVGGWTFRLRPSRLLALGLLMFAMVWDAFLIFWYGIALFQAHGGPGGVMVWFPLIHVAVGVYITYSAICGLVNHARLTLDRDRFTCARGPLPQRGRIVEPLVNVDGFRVTEQKVQSRNGSSVKALVQLLTHDGRSRELALALTDVLHARYIAGRLNRALDELRTPHTYRG